MKFPCSNCQQRFDVPAHWAGRTIRCTRCDEPILVPSPAEDPEQPPNPGDTPAPSKPSDTPAPPPPRKSSAPPTDVAPLRPMRPAGGPGLLTPLVLVVLLAAGAFEYAAFKNDESPQRTWRRFVRLFGGSAVPPPLPPSIPTLTLTPPPAIAHKPAAALPIPAPTDFPTATPLLQPDSLAWLAAHKNRWPKEVTLLQPQDFPAVFDGRVIGSVSLPAGTVVTLAGIAPREIEVISPGGGGKKIPPEATNVLEFARLEMARPEPVPTPIFLPPVAMPTATPTPAPTPTPTPAPNYFGSSGGSSN